MTLLGFKQQFAELVARRDKRMSIRAGARFREGQRLQLYTGLRTKRVRKLSDIDPVVVLTAVVRIDASGVSINDDPLADAEALALAQADGFASLEDFIEFFRSGHGLPFVGQLVKWDWQ